MKKQAANMAASYTGRGGKNKWNRSDDQESKEKKKLQYQSFVADVAHQVKKKHKSEKKSLASKESENFEMDEFNFAKFRTLDISNNELSKDIKYESDWLVGHNVNTTLNDKIDLNENYNLREQKSHRSLDKYLNENHSLFTRKDQTND